MIVHDDWIFVHNPKCAGSMIRGQLFNEVGAEFGFGPAWPQRAGERPGTTTHITQWELQEFFPEYFVYFNERPSFGLVRNPYDRFVSSYRYIADRFGYEGTAEDLADDLAKAPIEDFPKGRVAIEQHKMFFLGDYKRVPVVRKLEEVTDTHWEPVNGLTLDMSQYSNTTARFFPVDMTEKLRRKIRDIYARDFELFEFAT